MSETQEHAKFFDENLYCPLSDSDRVEGRVRVCQTRSAMFLYNVEWLDARTVMLSAASL